MSSQESNHLWEAGDVSASNTPQPPAITGLRVIRMLGAGGFGAVWLCEQSEPLQRQVAVKVLRTVAAGPRLRQRFEAERRHLARMDHPGIAQVFDAGETSEGSLYFIMELVTGEPLLNWCDRHTLSIQSRLDLARQVCSAVQHAHSKGIIHLDLKSANILVREVDGEPFVKVIDFGVAQLADDPDAVRSMTDQSIGPVGTLEYMAPEQLNGTRHLDTRADVYSLGITIYQLLTGLLPVDSRQLRAAGTIEGQRMIREVEFDPPSTRLARAMRTELPECAQRAHLRQLDPQQLVKVISGQLDAVVMHCLEKDPGRRYGTCDALSDDLGRWLAFEPVAAKPASNGVRIAKFVRRNRVGVAAAAAIALALTAGTIAMAYGLIEAQRQLTRAGRLREFNNDLLGAVAPDIAKGMDTRLIRLIFDTSMGSIDSQFADDALLAADAHHTAGVAYRSIGEYQLALQHLETEKVVLEKVLDPDDLDFLSSQNDLGNALMLVNRIDDAAVLLEHVYARRRALLGEDHFQTLQSLHNLAWLRDAQERPKEALALYQDVVARKRIALGDDDDSTLQSLNFLGEIQRRLGDFAAARATFEDVIARRTSLAGQDSTDALIARNNYLVVLRALGESLASEPLLRELIADMTRVLGDSHVLTLVANNNLAAILRDSSRLPEAEQIYRANLPRFEARHGAQSTYVLATLGNLALALEMQGMLDQAEPLYVDVIERKRAAVGAKSTSTLTSILNYGSLCWELNRHAEAQKHWLECASGLQETVGDSHPLTVRSKIRLAQAECQLGSPAKSLEMLANARPQGAAKLSADLELIALETTGIALDATGERAKSTESLAAAYELAVSIHKRKTARAIARTLARHAQEAADSAQFQHWNGIAEAAE